MKLLFSIQLPSVVPCAEYKLTYLQAERSEAFTIYNLATWLFTSIELDLTLYIRVINSHFRKSDSWENVSSGGIRKTQGLKIERRLPTLNECSNS